MHPAQLNLASQVTGHQRFLFVCLAPSRADATLADALDSLGQGLENMHEVTGHPSTDALQRGRFQFLREEPAHRQSCAESSAAVRWSRPPLSA